MLDGPRVHAISLLGEGKVYGGKDLPKSQVLSSEWKAGRVREDESGEDKELPCMIEGKSGVCIWWVSRRSVGNIVKK